MNTLIQGIIIHGDKIGRTIGYPTVNIDTPAPQSIKQGVWQGNVILQNSKRIHICAVIIGMPNKKHANYVEAHILDFNEDVYGQKISITLENFIRPLIKFENEEELKNQIEKDIHFIRENQKINMFTGIIQQTGELIKKTGGQEGMTLTIKKPATWNNLKQGESICVNGVCSTLKEFSMNDDLIFEYMPESIKRTAISQTEEGMKLNLEQSLTLSDRLDGHLVTGHIDTTGVVTDIQTEGNSNIITIQLNNPIEFMPLIAPKGSIAIDGISLTVVTVEKNSFTVKIIPYTKEHTNLLTKKNGDKLNIECDLIAKYISRMIPKNIC